MSRRETDSPNWGGVREGAGRKNHGRIPVSFRLNPAEAKAVRAFIKRFRERAEKAKAKAEEE